MSALLAHVHFGSFGPLDWVLTALAALVGGVSIWLAVRYTLRPGESDPGHVKYLILDEPRTGAGRPADPRPADRA